MVTTQETLLADVLRNAAEYGVAARVIGRVLERDLERNGRGHFRIKYNGAAVIQATTAALHNVWAGAIERAVLGEGASNR